MRFLIGLFLICLLAMVAIPLALYGGPLGICLATFSIPALTAICDKYW